VEAEYSIANGRSHDATVIYGDTDSVMVKFGPTDLEQVMALGRHSILIALEMTMRKRTGNRQGSCRVCLSEIYQAYQA
jgi:hypothetical protein